QADQLLADTRSEIERHRAAAQREVDELSKQKESISTHLAQISQLLGTQMPGLADALKPPARPAVAAAAPKAVAPPPAAPQPAPPPPPTPLRAMASRPRPSRPRPPARRPRAERPSSRSRPRQPSRTTRSGGPSRRHQAWRGAGAEAPAPLPFAAVSRGRSGPR